MSTENFDKTMRVISMCFFTGLFGAVVYGAFGIAALIWDKV